MPFVRIGDSLPSGATLVRMDGDIALHADFAAEGRTVRFRWDVTKVPNAQGVQWQVQVARADTEQIAVSGKGSGAQGSFSVNFATIPRPPRAGVDDPLWYVSVLPLGSSGTVVGQRSNCIRVFDKTAPSSGPQFKIDVGQWYVKPGAPIRMTRFESVPYRYVDEWPPGCEHYQGAGSQQTPWGWAAGAVKDAFDWTSQAYQDAKNYVVTGVVDIFPFVPRPLAEAALDAALASAGIPPSIPNFNQMLTHGSDYLAGQMVNELAKQAPAGSGLALELGKEELRKRIQEKARDAIRETAQKIQEPGADSKYCVGKEYPPFLKITVQNAGTQTCRGVQVKLSMSFDPAALGYTDFSVPNQPGLPSYFLLPLHGPLLRPFEPFRIDQIDPGQSLTIPVDIFSHMNIDALPYDTSTGTGLTGKDISHWRGFYKFGQFSFTVDGGRTGGSVTYVENGYHVGDDGMGFSFKSPKRAWMDEPFVWS